MYGTVTRERYDKMLRLARDAGVNSSAFGAAA